MRQCQHCGADFAARSPRAKFCSDRCRYQAHVAKKRGGQVVPIRKPDPATPPAPMTLPGDDATGSPLVDALRDAFKPEDLGSPAGQVALRLASDVDRLIPGAPGYAAIVAQMRAAIDDLRSQAAPKAVTPLALIRERRAADRAASTG